MRSSMWTAFTVFVAALTFATGCGSHSATVTPVTPVQAKIAFSSGRATGDVTAEPYIMNRDGSSVTPLPYRGIPSMGMATNPWPIPSASP